MLEKVLISPSLQILECEVNQELICEVHCQPAKNEGCTSNDTMPYAYGVPSFVHCWHIYCSGGVSGILLYRTYVPVRSYGIPGILYCCCLLAVYTATVAAVQQYSRRYSSCSVQQYSRRKSSHKKRARNTRLPQPATTLCCWRCCVKIYRKLAFVGFLCSYRLLSCVHRFFTAERGTVGRSTNSPLRSVKKSCMALFYSKKGEAIPTVISLSQ